MGITKSDIRPEIDLLRHKLSNLGSPVVFAHNDLLLGNVIYTKERNSVTFIDFEYAAMNYQAYDIGNHFAEFIGEFCLKFVYVHMWYVVILNLLFHVSQRVLSHVQIAINYLDSTNDCRKIFVNIFKSFVKYKQMTYWILPRKLMTR